MIKTAWRRCRPIRIGMPAECTPSSPPSDTSRLPPLGRDDDGCAQSDAAADWLAHLEAGRIEVR